MKMVEHAIELGKACEKLRKVLDFVPEGTLREHAEEILEEGVYEYSRAIVELESDAIQDDMKKGLI